MRNAQRLDDAVTRRLDEATLGVLGLLATSNVVANSVLHDDWYVPWNLAVTAAGVGLATQRGGLTAAELGLGQSDLGAGVRVGAAAAAVIGTAVALATAHPTSRQAFVDDRGRVDGRELAVRVLFRVPAGTALLEEVAFRGALPGLLEARRGWSHRRAVLVSSALFGVWHVLPSLSLNDTNRAMSGRLSGRSGQASAVLGSVATTFAAGLVFSWLRDLSGSVVAPIVTHSAINGAGHVAAWRVSSSHVPEGTGPPGEEP